MFNEGEFHKHPENARKEVEAVIEIMKPPSPTIYSADQYPLRHIFQSAWQRVAKVFAFYSLLSPCIASKTNRGAEYRRLRDLSLVSRLNFEIRTLLIVWQAHSDGSSEQWKGTSWA